MACSSSSHRRTTYSVLVLLQRQVLTGMFVRVFLLSHSKKITTCLLVKHLCVLLLLFCLLFQPKQAASSTICATYLPHHRHSSLLQSLQQPIAIKLLGISKPTANQSLSCRPLRNVPLRNVRPSVWLTRRAKPRRRAPLQRRHRQPSTRRGPASLLGILGNLLFVRRQQQRRSVPLEA